MKITKEISEESLKKPKVILAIFISKVKKKLKQYGRNYDTFIKKAYCEGGGFLILIKYD